MQDVVFAFERVFGEGDLLGQSGEIHWPSDDDATAAVAVFDRDPTRAEARQHRC